MPKTSESDVAASHRQAVNAFISPVARILSTAYFVLFAAVTVFQAPLFGSRTEPTIVGLPFGLGWTVCWAAGAAFVLIALEWHRGR
jgi:hypothetical protein